LRAKQMPASVDAKDVIVDESDPGRPASGFVARSAGFDGWPNARFTTVQAASDLSRPRETARATPKCDGHGKIRDE
jgi:hypothetical protein